MDRTSQKHITLVLLVALLLLCAGCGTAAGTAAVENIPPVEAEPSAEVEFPTEVETPVTSGPSVLPEEPVAEPEPEPEIELKEGETLTATGHILTQVDGVTYVDGVIIVNKTYSIPESYPQKSMTDEARAALNVMIEAAAAEGITLVGRTDYRSYSFQATLYNNDVAKDGQAEADRYSARPGHSEHHTGLAIDLNSLETWFGQTPEGLWLSHHCAEYGYIIRYPEGKEPITGYMYEPWHVRYVGTELAQELYLGDGQFVTLEEHFGITSAYQE